MGRFKRDAKRLEQVAPSIGHLAGIGAEHDRVFRDESVGERDAKTAGQMVVACSGLPKGGIDAARRAMSLFIAFSGDGHDGFQHVSHMRGREPVVAMSALAATEMRRLSGSFAKCSLAVARETPASPPVRWLSTRGR